MKGFASIAGSLLIVSIILLSIITFVSFIIDIKKKKSFKNTCLISLSSLLYFVLFGAILEKTEFSGFMAGLGEAIFCMLAIIIFLVSTFIDVCIILIKKAQLKEKKILHSLIIILGVFFVFVSFVYFSAEVVGNIGTHKGQGIVVDSQLVENGYYYTEDGASANDNYYLYTIEFEINGKKYEDIKGSYSFDKELQVGDEVDIVYSSRNYNTEKEYYLTYFDNYKMYYIPSLILGGLILFLEFKDKRKIRLIDYI